MAKRPSNQAAFCTEAKGHPIEVRDAPYTSPGDDEIVIKNAAIAINPIDWIVPQSGAGGLGFPWIKYPFIFGSDVAGEVVEIGRNVKRFKVGDRVIGLGMGEDKTINDSARKAFQMYTIVFAKMASPIPDNLSYESACVMPLGLSTAACGLFEKDQLALTHPSINPKSSGKTLLIWGGSTSVGSNAIQLSVAAGYEVITTCSPRNFDFVKRLGASEAFDYNSRTVVADIIKAFKGKKMAGALSVGNNDACRDIVGACEGDKILSLATFPTPTTPPERFILLQTILVFVSGSFRNWLMCRVKGLRYKYIYGSSLAFNEVGKAVYEDFLPAALARGSFVAAPEAQVVGQGLEHIQAALDAQRKGLSAKKAVISL